MVFGGKIVSANLMEKKILSLIWAEKIYSESTLCLTKMFLEEQKKNIIANFLSRYAMKRKFILTPKKPIAPPPLC